MKTRTEQIENSATFKRAKVIIYAGLLILLGVIVYVCFTSNAVSAHGVNI